MARASHGRPGYGVRFSKSIAPEARPPIYCPGCAFGAPAAQHPTRCHGPCPGHATTRNTKLAKKCRDTLVTEGETCQKERNCFLTSFLRGLPAPRVSAYVSSVFPMVPANIDAPAAGASRGSGTSHIGCTPESKWVIE